MQALALLSPAEVEPRGLFGERLRLCRENLLLAKDESALLGGFLHRPGSHPWIGEHVGKWLAAACSEFERTAADADSAGLRDKIDRVAAALRSAQEPDGYLGTYLREQRWTEWDVWVHKYVLIGLLAHHRARGEEVSLLAARRVGELLLATFRQGPLDLMSARVSTHAGMAAGSLLVAVCQLARATGDARHLEFARWIAQQFEQPGGPRIATSLLAGKGVHETANGKAYELLSCLCGLVDLAALTGDATLAEPAVRAFDDIVRNHLHVTGGLSHEEYFRAPGSYPSTGDVSETCALVTWMQLCAALFQLRGERRFLEPFERAAWNHLLAAQRADGGSFCYFTPLAGPRNYRTDINCCGSSGPRGLTLVPQLIVATRSTPTRPEVQIHLLMDARARFAVTGARVELDITTDFANARRGVAPSRATIRANSDAEVDLVIYRPSWAGGGTDPLLRATLSPGPAREFAVELAEVTLQTIPGRHREQGRVARQLGPFVLACPDEPDGQRQRGAPLPCFFEPFGLDPSGALQPTHVWDEALP